MFINMLPASAAVAISQKILEEGTSAVKIQAVSFRREQPLSLDLLKIMDVDLTEPTCQTSASYFENLLDEYEAYLALP